jgi:predicted NBD/HSP70 family sugar kinase
MRILAIDIGGTNVKFLMTGEAAPRRFPSGTTLQPAQMVEKLREATADWEFDCVTIGYPGPVVHNRILLEPRNLGRGWVGFDFAAALGKPTRIINDAAMQALGSYEGGRMLFLGLGTGLGTTFIIDKTIAPMELAHLPYRKGKTFEDYVGERGLERLGSKKWQRAVHDVSLRLKAALVADYVVIGGGNSKKLEELPPGARLGDNANAFVGGFRFWQEYA